MDAEDPSPSSTSPSQLPPSTTRCTTHYRDKGGLSYTLCIAWMHFRPFLPFLMISCLVVALIFVLQKIVYGGPFTDPLFFSKFEQRWPVPHHQTTTPTTTTTHGIIETSLESNQSVAT